MRIDKPAGIPGGLLERKRRRASGELEGVYRIVYEKTREGLRRGLSAAEVRRAILGTRHRDGPDPARLQATVTRIMRSKHAFEGIEYSPSLDREGAIDRVCCAGIADALTGRPPRYP